MGCALVALALGWIARRFDPDTDLRAPLFLVSGILLIYALAVAPIISILAFIGGFARTIGGTLAIMEVIALSGAVIILLILRLLRT